jgi:hypothetical protein
MDPHNMALPREGAMKLKAAVFVRGSRFGFGCSVTPRIYQIAGVPLSPMQVPYLALSTRVESSADRLST